MKKIEIIARIAEAGKVAEEQTLLTWSDADISTTQRHNPQILHYPGLEIYLDQRCVLKDGQDVRLTKYEYALLSFMAQHPGVLFSKEQLFEAVWHENSESCMSAISNTIGRIRQKIETDKEHPYYIQTVSSLGYRFAPELIKEK